MRTPQALPAVAGIAVAAVMLLKVTRFGAKWADAVSTGTTINVVLLFMMQMGLVEVCVAFASGLP